MSAAVQAAPSVLEATLPVASASTTLSESALPNKKVESYALSQSTVKTAAQIAVAHTIALIKAKSLNQQLEKSASEMSTKRENAQAAASSLNEVALNQQTQKV